MRAGRKPIYGEFPAASTEVVMAPKLFLRSRYASAVVSLPVGRRADLRAFA